MRAVRRERVEAISTRWMSLEMSVEQIQGAI